MGTHSQPEQTWVYRHVWEIVSDDRPLSALRAEAVAAVDVLAALAGAKLIGEPVVTVAGRRVVLEAPAEPLPSSQRPEVTTAVVRLVWVGWPDGQIAQALDRPVAEVVQIRESRRLPAVRETRPAAPEWVEAA